MLKKLLAMVLMTSVLVGAASVSGHQAPPKATPPAKPKSSKKMKLRITPPWAYPDYILFFDMKGSKRKFKPGEDVSFWGFYRKSTPSFYSLVRADAKGRVKGSWKIIGSITYRGRNTVCAHGETSNKVACGTYVLRNSP